MLIRGEFLAYNSHLIPHMDLQQNLILLLVEKVNYEILREVAYHKIKYKTLHNT